MWVTTEGELFYWKSYYGLWNSILARSDSFMLKRFNDGFVSSKHTQDINWWIGVVWIPCGLLWCFYQLFGLSFWRHPFTAEDPLVTLYFVDILTWNIPYIFVCVCTDILFFNQSCPFI